ncbi:hypothetical protein LUCX_130 [Xanthomonas phage vB_XciM_LucasX]|nr:hypothetical protein LUCX_130 [Xanthomonas phage vB_XciM_LucasX]
MSSNVVCLYHDDCYDGLGAAWALFKRFPDAEFISVRYKEAPPSSLKGKVVYIVDFCYPFDDLMSILFQEPEELFILDHHKGMDTTIHRFNLAVWLFGLDPTRFRGLFDATRSGALITWETLHPDLPVPQIIRHISDRDLWRFELDGTKEVMAGLGSYQMDLQTWDRLFRWTPDYDPEDSGDPHFAAIDSFESDGYPILRKLQIDIDRVKALTQRQITLGDYTVPLVNVPRMMASEALEQLALGQPFAVGYFDTADYREYSLRSTKGVGADVIEIARLHGGGGHPNAAGFRVPRDHPLAQL